MDTTTIGNAAQIMLQYVEEGLTFQSDMITTVPVRDYIDPERCQREGMYASEKGAETLSIYQESRIRHVHQTLDKYLND
jgi:hypothetical protein